MKPIKITIKGINSYVTEQVVHFDKVAENKLFGIFGETGSGKTTILDCIVMALYGTSERESIQNIINVHNQDAYIIFDFGMYFEGEDKKFRVERQHRIQKNGIVKSSAILTDLDTDIVLAEKVEDVNEMLQRIVGVGKKEFLKCIAIPQGEFDAFLGDTPLNRKKTISKLFNLEHFGVALQEKIKNRKNTYTTKKLTIEEKLAMYNDISEFNLSNLEMELLENEKKKIDTEFKLNVEKTKNIMLINDFDNLIKLNEAKYEFERLEDRKDEIDFNRKQIEYTNAYGNYLNVNDRYQNTLTEIKKINEEIRLINHEFDLIDKSVREETNHKTKLLNKKQQLEVKRSELLSQVSEHNLVSESVDKLQVKINKLVDLSDDYDKKLKDYNQSITDLKNANQEVYLELDEQNMLYKQCEKVLSRLKESTTLDLRKNFADRLNVIIENIDKFNINSLNDKNKTLFEVVSSQISELKQEQLDIIKDVLEALDIEFKGQDIETIKKEAEKQKDEIMKVIMSCNEKMQENTSKINSTSLVINSTKLLKSNVVKEYKAATKEFNELNERLNNLASEEDLKIVVDEIQLCDDDIAAEEENIYQILQLKNKLDTDIQVKTAEVEKLNKTAQELKEVLNMFEFDKMKNEVENNRDLLLSTDAEIAATQEVINTFDNDYAYLSTTIKEYDAKIHNKEVTKEQITASEENIVAIQEELNTLLTHMGALQNNIKIQSENLETVKRLKVEYKDVLKELNTIQKLQDMIANGALMEYIAEEYMYLITDFANNYIYSISKGKYLLKYDKDFYVLDNFNGGIARTVKTLSGGERFIVSLSLALGITQSIATNNNKNFNFFFIDEGFGSLSENYIDKILQSFDTLIKLNFTVGFITHVEKMKNYITNRIVVTKKNNDQGSYVEEEY
ncbi:MAG: SMC family ATPase [Clostridia bacterium]|nr:SMC family ATPase [Clostridia bacterium]